MANILVYADGSLGNRIRGLINAVAFIKGHFTLFWPINNWCGAEYSSLFDNNKFIQQVSSSGLRVFHEQIKFLKGSKVLVSHSDQINHKLFDYVVNPSNILSPKTLISRLVCKYDNVIFYTVEVHPSIPLSVYRSVLGSFNTTTEVQQIVEDFLRRLPVRRFISFHVRLTDSKIPFYRYEKLVKRIRKGSALFISSDDPVAESRLMELHPNSFVFPKSAYPSLLDSNRSWTDLVTDNDGRLLPYNKNIDQFSVKEALIDLMILGHGIPVFTNKGSFLELAIVASSRHTFFSRSLLQLRVYRYFRLIKILFVHLKLSLFPVSHL